jgi:cyclophilin family peptidyl-prolyl cis-trans isomerase
VKSIVLIAAIAAAVAIAGGVIAYQFSQQPQTSNQPAQSSQESKSPVTADMTTGNEIAEIKTAQGTIKVEFFPNAAPKHVESFLNLSKDGFYDGTLFHRIAPGFVIQGGDPLSKSIADKGMWGTGDPGYSLPAEFSDIPHTRGIVSMARSSDPNSAGSQFFIVLEDSDLIRASLDERYTVFGRVIEGMDVVDKIASLQRVGGSGSDREQPANPDDARIISIEILER